MACSSGMLAVPSRTQLARRAASWGLRAATSYSVQAHSAWHTSTSLATCSPFVVGGRNEGRFEKVQGRRQGIKVHGRQLLLPTHHY